MFILAMFWPWVLGALGAAAVFCTVMDWRAHRAEQKVWGKGPGVYHISASGTQTRIG
jgi:hypothetical protein